MYTLDQIKNFSLHQVEADPKLLSLMAKLYDPSVSPGSMLNYWKSGYRNFDADKNYAISQLVSGGALRAIGTYGWADKYTNWNNPDNPASTAKANEVKEKALKELSDFKKRMDALGIDVSSIPQYQQYFNVFQSGMTAQQRAELDAQNRNFLDPNTPADPNIPIVNQNGTGGDTNAQTTQSSGGSGYLYSDQFLNSKANNAAVNQLYNSYFGRNATQAELNNWGQGGGADTTVKALEDFLKQERTRYNVTTPITPIPTSGGGTGTTPPSGNGTPTPPSGNGTPTTNNITFRDGLTQAQKDSITALSQKPFSQWNDNDKANWQYGTNGSPFPSGGSGSGNGTPTPTPTPSGNGNGTTPPTINPADAKWVNDLYQKYFDRTATSAEIANWIQANPQALEQFLGAEQKKYGYVSTAMGAERKARYDAAMAKIDASNLPDDLKQLWKTVVGNYPDATDFKPEEIINTFNKIKNETIDPYFKELTDVAISDLKTTYNSLNVNRQSELEAERANAGQEIRQAKTGLEKSGMTFTGQGIENLGAQSAYAQNNNNGTVAEGTALQTPFGGLFYEGNVNQANRLVSTSSASRYHQAQQDLGRRAEGLIGSGGVMSALPGLQYTPAGVNLTGQYGVEKTQKYSSTLQGIIDNWRNAQKLKTNI